MAIVANTQREWIAAEFSKGIESEQSLIDEALARASSPPDPSLQVLYHEIASADERHRSIVEKVAVRYGHTPSNSIGGGIGGTIGRLREKVGELGSTPQQLVAHDLGLKANSIHWYTAWIAAFTAVNDVESAREMTAILTEEKAHRDALQEALNRLLTRGALGETADPS